MNEYAIAYVSLAHKDIDGKYCNLFHVYHKDSSENMCDINGLYQYFLEKFDLNKVKRVEIQQRTYFDTGKLHSYHLAVYLGG